MTALESIFAEIDALNNGRRQSSNLITITNAQYQIPYIGLFTGMPIVPIMVPCTGSIFNVCCTRAKQDLVSGRA